MTNAPNRKSLSLDGKIAFDSSVPIPPPVGQPVSLFSFMDERFEVVRLPPGQVFGGGPLHVGVPLIGAGTVLIGQGVVVPELSRITQLQL